MVIEIRLDRDDVTTTKQSRKPCRTADDMSMREEKVSAATPQKWGNKSTGSGWRQGGANKRIEGGRSSYILVDRVKSVNQQGHENYQNQPVTE